MRGNWECPPLPTICDGHCAACVLLGTVWERPISRIIITILFVHYWNTLPKCTNIYWNQTIHIKNMTVGKDRLLTTQWVAMIIKGIHHYSSVDIHMRYGDQTHWYVWILRMHTHWQITTSFSEAREQLLRTSKSKHRHETDLYCSIWDELTCDEKLGSSAFQRPQARLNLSNISPFRGDVLICSGRKIVLSPLKNMS